MLPDATEPGHVKRGLYKSFDEGGSQGLVSPDVLVENTTANESSLAPLNGDSTLVTLVRSGAR